VVAIRKRVITAVAAAAVELTTGHEAVVMDEFPGGEDIQAGAPILAGAKAETLRREWLRNGTVGCDAKAIGRGASCGEGPAATARGLVADVIYRLGTLGPAGERIKLVRGNEARCLQPLNRMLTKNITRRLCP
jgi:hypothetical protein